MVAQVSKMQIYRGKREERYILHKINILILIFICSLPLLRERCVTEYVKQKFINNNINY